MDGNSVIEAIESRRSIRSYRADMVPDDIVDRIVEAGTFAATGSGLQSPIIIVVRDRSMRDRLSKMNADIMGVDTDPFYGAPVVLMVSGGAASTALLVMACSSKLDLRDGRIKRSLDGGSLVVERVG